MPEFIYKPSKKQSNGPGTGSRCRHDYITQNWVLLSAHKPDDPFLPLQYKIKRSCLESFAPLYNDPSSKRRTPKPKGHAPRLVTKSDLTNSSESVQEHGSLPSSGRLPGSVGSLQALTKKWESANHRYHLWKNRNSLLCEPPAQANIVEPTNESPTEDSIDKESEIFTEDLNPQMPYKATWTGEKPDRDEGQGLFDNQMPKATSLTGLLDSQQHFPEESVSSDEDARLKKRDADKDMGLLEIPKTHQRKYRRLRRATRDLIAWIDSLKPDKPLDFHMVTNLDGTKTTVPMKPYVPYPDDEQPLAVIKEDEVVEMVKNSYGSRPAMTLRVAVRDMENLPEELEKFDNVNYLKRKVIEDRIYRKGKKTVESKDVKPITRYSFGFAPETPRNRRISAVGTIFDAKTRRHCRYGAWYLKQSVWRKMDAAEEIKQGDAHDSDEAFERVTGQKRLYAVDANMPSAITDAAPDSSVAHLHTAKEFYKLLKARGRPIPAWLQPCEGALQQIEIEEASKTAPFGSEVWRKVRDTKNQLNACHAPRASVESLLRTDLYCFDTGYVRPVHLAQELSENIPTGLDKDCYAFLEELEKSCLQI